MKLRNKINEQENSHSEMFDTINKRLTDYNFIQSAIGPTGLGMGMKASTQA